MGLDAQLIAIGPFSAEVMSALEYEEKYYTNVRTGATVVTNVFVAGTSSASHKLAGAFGFGAMEFGRHHVNPQAVDIQSLEGVFEQRFIERFLLLRAHNFNFYYLPNG